MISKSQAETEVSFDFSTANCGTLWGQNFSYDPFGNISKNHIAGSGGADFAPTYTRWPKPFPFRLFL